MSSAARSHGLLARSDTPVAYSPRRPWQDLWQVWRSCHSSAASSPGRLDVMSTQITQARSGSKETAPIPRAGLVAWICLLIVYVVWGSTYLAIRVGVETMPPLLMAAARSLVAGLIMFPLGLRRRRSAPFERRWPSRVQWRACAAAGVLLLVGQGVVGVAERTIPSGLAALLIATVPLWLLGLDAGLNRARLGRAQLAGLLLGLAGVALLSSLGGGGGGRVHVSVAGVLIVLGAAGMWAL